MPWNKIPAAAAALALLVSGCSSSGNSNAIDVRSKYVGTVIADEAQAATAGRDVLLQNGTAADAAVAVATSLALTLPSRAGLGGGGVCLVHGADRPGVEAIDFLPRSAPGTELQIPGMVRGLAALQARYGALRWQQTLAPAEKLASLGVEAGPAFLADAARANLTLTRTDGAPLQAGNTLKQEGSGAILAQIRVRGASDFYNGRLADHLIRAGLPSAELAGYTPAWQETLRVRTDEGVVHFPQTSAGRMGQAVWTAIAAAPERALDPARRLALAHGAGAQALASLSAGATVDAASDAGSTGFLVTDGFGGAVACSLTMGGLFGTGATLGDLDILGARPVTPQSVLALSMAPMIDLNASRNDVAGILVASGSPAASVDGVSVLYGGLAAKKPLQQVLAEPRSLDDGAGQPGSTSPPAASAADWIGAMICSDGLKKAPESCRAARDPRSGGIIFQVAK